MMKRSVTHVKLYRAMSTGLKYDHTVMDGVKKVLVAFSGGVDSSVLLHLMKDYRKKHDIDVAVVHINHGLRGKESDEDAEFCRETAAQYQMAFFLERMVVHSPMAPEHVLRAGRYQKLESTALRIGAQRIFLAHHLDDQAETVLFRLLTGTDVSGLSGMRRFRRPYYVRPLLSITKKSILKEAEECRVPFRFDSSNLKTHSRRNFLRQQLIPLVQSQFNPRISNHLAELAVSFRDCGNLIQVHVLKLEANISVGTKIFSVKGWASAPRAVRMAFLMRMYKASIEESGGGLRRNQLLLLEKMLLSPKTFGSADLPGGIRCVKEKTIFFFEKVSPKLRSR